MKSVSLAALMKKANPSMPTADRRTSSRRHAVVSRRSAPGSAAAGSGPKTQATRRRQIAAAMPRAQGAARQPTASMSRPISGTPTRVLPAQENSISPITSPRRW